MERCPSILSKIKIIERDRKDNVEKTRKKQTKQKEKNKSQPYFWHGYWHPFPIIMSRPLVKQNVKVYIHPAFVKIAVRDRLEILRKVEKNKLKKKKKIKSQPYFWR